MQGKSDKKTGTVGPAVPYRLSPSRALTRYYSAQAVDRRRMKPRASLHVRSLQGREIGLREERRTYRQIERYRQRARERANRT